MPKSEIDKREAEYQRAKKTAKKKDRMTYYADKTKTEAFAEFGARTNNKVNEYSAIAEDGSIVLECWYQHITSLPDRSWRYQVDNLSEWLNPHGKDVMLKHLRLAVDEDRPVRLIIAKLKNNPNADIARMDASNEPKDIITYHDRIGKVVKLTADNLIIDFRKEKTPNIKKAPPSPAITR